MFDLKCRVCRVFDWKCRVLQLGIVAETPAEFLSQAKEIVLRHKELQSQATSLQEVISQLDAESHKLVGDMCSFR